MEEIAERFWNVAPAADLCSIRVVRERNEHLTVRRGILHPPHVSSDLGAMVTVCERGGVGYAATSDLTEAGLRRAAEDARRWAALAAERPLFDYRRIPRPRGRESSESAVRVPWGSIPLAAKIDLLREQCERLHRESRIVNWEAALWHTDAETLIATSDGSLRWQRFSYLLPQLSVTANQGAETQTRTFGGHAYCRQGGFEILDETGFRDAAPRLAAEALELLAAPDCPSGRMDLVLAADQMILQIHESIGHPLELDRILGDERNYAGTSFVTPDMFGSYRYGSELLDVTFDPTRPEQAGSYAFDDDGQPAERQFVIRRGVLLRPLGGVSSQIRAGLPGVANARATSWNRPPIDRMANLNLEPGTSRFDDMVAAVERGVYMETNCSWSIDDSRNKFQFGCELGRRIENGRLTGVVKKPSYRGVSATFWRNLKAVGDRDTFEVLGTPYCGKGEPNQVIRVGHASPPCLFADVEVFGGA